MRCLCGKVFRDLRGKMMGNCLSGVVNVLEQHCDGRSGRLHSQFLVLHFFDLVKRLQDEDVEPHAQIGGYHMH